MKQATHLPVPFITLVTISCLKNSMQEQLLHGAMTSETYDFFGREGGLGEGGWAVDGRSEESMNVDSDFYRRLLMVTPELQHGQSGLGVYLINVRIPNC